MSLKSIPTGRLINGIKKAFANDESFLDDANVLKNNKKWAHGYSFCQLAIEELSKITILFQLWIDRINGNEIKYKKLDNDFKNHIEKTKLSVETEKSFFLLYKEYSGARWVDDAIKKGDEFIQNIKLSNNLKNESLYVTIQNNDFQSPDEIITKEIFDSIYGTALMRKMIFEKLLKGSEKYIYEIARLFNKEVENSKNDNK